MGDTKLRSVVCPVCAKKVRVTKLGTIAVHSTLGKKCPNSLGLAGA